MSEQRLIDADSLLKRLEPLEPRGGHKIYQQACNDMIHKFFPQLIAEAPTVDAVPVVRGEWIEHEDEMECPQCGYFWNYCDNDTERFNYCPNCGAKMEAKE